MKVNLFAPSLSKTSFKTLHPVIALTSCAVLLGVSPLTLTAHAAKKPARKAAKTASLKRKPGYVVGRVTNSQDKPLSGAQVAIYGTTIAGANTRFEVTTQANGQFSQRVPEGIYGTTAYYKTRYNGKNYNFTIPPTDGVTAQRHDSAPGIVKEFKWKISGLKPGERPGEAGTHTEPGKYFGGYILYKSEEKGTLNTPIYFRKGSTIIVTLTPRARLIDGSQGKPVSFKRTFAQDEPRALNWYLTNIPIGIYKLSTRLISADGTEKTLGVKRSLDFSGNYAPSVNVDFEPTSFGDMQLMQITVDPPVEQ